MAHSSGQVSTGSIRDDRPGFPGCHLAEETNITSINQTVGGPALGVAFVLPSLLRAGAETQTVNLVNGLPASAIDKHLFIFEKQLDQLDRLHRQEVALHHWPRRYRLDLRPMRALAKLIDERQLRVVHCSLQIALFVGWVSILLSRSSPPLVLALHTTKNVAARDDVFDVLLYQWIMRACARVICVCRAQEEHWIARFPFLRGRTSVVYNGVDVDAFDPARACPNGLSLRRKLSIREGEFVASSIAGFRPEKRHDLILRAFARVLREHPDSVLLLAGIGPELPRTQQLASELRIADRVRFLGLVSDVRPVLAASDISIIGSTSESFSMSMLESLAMQVPVVATAVGGAGEAIIDGRTGRLVRPGDHEALAVAIGTLAADRATRIQMGVNGRELVLAQFTSERMIGETLAILKTVGGDHVVQVSPDR